MKVDRLVLDTNVLISAVLSSSGAPSLLLNSLHRTRSALVFSDPTMAELTSRLMLAKFDRYFDRDTRLCFLAEIDAVAEFVGISGARMGCRDRSDDQYLETALAGNCWLIVSGDRDLLKMHPWDKVQILRPTQVLEALSASN
jgi:putative PIN family toxin of toxin-antitoxin system